MEYCEITLKERVPKRKVEKLAIKGVPKDIIAFTNFENKYSITHIPTGCFLGPVEEINREATKVRKWWKSLTKEERKIWKEATFKKVMQTGLRTLGLKEPPFSKLKITEID